MRTAWAHFLLGVMPPAPARVADVGCGTGSLSLLLASAGYQVAALDISPGMIQRARGKLTASRLPVDVVCADAAAPPWAAHSFDAVVARHVLWAMADPEAAIARWLELLAAGGHLVLVEGHWSTGGGIGAREALRLVHRFRADAELVALRDEDLWGGPITDERYAVIVRA